MVQSRTRPTVAWQALGNMWIRTYIYNTVYSITYTHTHITYIDIIHNVYTYTYITLDPGVIVYICIYEYTEGFLQFCETRTLNRQILYIIEYNLCMGPIYIYIYYINIYIYIYLHTFVYIYII